MWVTRSDNTWTRDNGQLRCFTDRERDGKPLDLAVEEEDSGDSRRPSWSLGLRQRHLKYYKERALKRLLNLKPSTAILGSSHISYM